MRKILFLMFLTYSIQSIAISQIEKPTVFFDFDYDIGLINQLMYSNELNIVVVGSNNSGMVYILNRMTGEILKIIELGSFQGLTIDNNRNKLIIAYLGRKNYQILEYDLVALKDEGKVFQLYEEYYKTVYFDIKNKIFASLDIDGNLNIFDIKNEYSHISTLRLHKKVNFSDIWSMILSEDGSKVILGASTNRFEKIYVYDIKKNQLNYSISNFNKEPEIFFTDDLLEYLIVANDKQVYVYNLTSGKLNHQYRFERNISSATIIKEKKILIVGHDKGFINIYNYKENKLIVSENKMFVPSRSPIENTNKENGVAHQDFQGFVRLIDLKNKDTVFTYSTPSSVRTLEFNQNNNSLYSLQSNSVVLWSSLKKEPAVITPPVKYLDLKFSYINDVSFLNNTLLEIFPSDGECSVFEWSF